jgi:hypothetical protein
MVERKRKEIRTQNLNSSFLTVDEAGRIMPETSEAALVAAQAYLLTMQPEPREPQESMHQAAIKGLGLIGDKLKQKPLEKETTRHEQKEKEVDCPNLHKPEDLVHLVREITNHKGTMQGTSSHRPG